MSNESGLGKLKIFALNSNQPLAEKIAKQVGTELGKTAVKHFSDGEIQISIEESIRGAEVFTIQSISDPINTSLMELLIMVDAVRRASASTINVVIPYYGYSRADRKARAREPITAKLVASLLEMDGVDRVVSLDLHAAQLQGFFDIPVDHFLAAPILANYFVEQHNTDDLVFVSPDHASVSRARKLAELLKSPIAIIDNRDPEGGYSATNTVIGDVKGKHAILVDDIIDTGVRVATSAEVLINAGAKDVSAVATHALFSGDARDKIDASPLKEVVVTDSIQLPTEKISDKMTILTVSEMLGDAIGRIYRQEPVDSLFKSNANRDVHL